MRKKKVTWDTSNLTIEGYFELRKDGWSDKEIREEFWLSANEFKEWFEHHKKEFAKEYYRLKQKKYSDKKIGELWGVNVWRFKQKIGLTSSTSKSAKLTKNKYLEAFFNGVSDEEICLYTNITLQELNKLKAQWGFNRLINLSIAKYQKYKNEGFSDLDIALIENIDVNDLKFWKQIQRGLEENITH